MKPNKCDIYFKCGHSDDQISKMNCVYRTTKQTHDCDYTDENGNCFSTVARVNAMFLACKKVGIELITKNKMTHTK